MIYKLKNGYEKENYFLKSSCFETFEAAEMYLTSKCFLQENLETWTDIWQSSLS